MKTCMCCCLPVSDRTGGRPSNDLGNAAPAGSRQYAGTVQPAKGHDGPGEWCPMWSHADHEEV
jgi:hypothetical protein